MKGFQVYQSKGVVLLVIAFILVYFQIIPPLIAGLVTLLGAYIIYLDDKKRKSKSKF